MYIELNGDYILTVQNVFKKFLYLGLEIYGLYYVYILIDYM